MREITSRESGREIWQPVECGMADCLSDPLMQGIYYDSRGIHFATNYGLSSYTGVSYLVDPDLEPNLNREGWRLPQLTDKKIIIMAPKTNILAYVLKLMDGGHYFKYAGTFEDAITELREAGYEFIRPPVEDPLKYLRWILEMQQELGNQRINNISYEFAKRVAEKWRLPDVSSIQEWLKNEFTNPDI